MTGRLLRDTVNLMIYGGSFIGLCAACITALTFEITGRTQQNLTYIFFIGAATAALYCGHRVIGLKKLEHVKTTVRFQVIRKYKSHIWIYCVLWILISLYLFVSLANVEFVLWLAPGSIIALLYVLPIFPGGKRLRDLGWGKIILIGWSWAWLTAFVPLFHFTTSSIQIAVIHTLERMLFIILLTIPFEIRDISVDKSVGLMTLPERFGRKTTIRISFLLGGFITFLALVTGFHYFNPAYVVAMSFTCALTIPLIYFSYTIDDDYYFGGLIDGLMILVLWIFTVVNIFI